LFPKVVQFYKKKSFKKLKIMKLKITIFFLAALFSLSITSCTNGDNNSSSNNTPATGADGFTWTDSSGATVQTVNNPYASSQYKTIFATITSGSTVYEINLTSIAVGTYNLSASGNALYYKNAAMSTAFSPTSGTVVITANASNKLSGTFTATGSGGGITSVSGQFKNIVINP
jgi:hypothetical protein